MSLFIIIQLSQCLKKPPQIYVQPAIIINLIMKKKIVTIAKFTQEESKNSSTIIIIIINYLRKIICNISRKKTKVGLSLEV